MMNNIIYINKKNTATGVCPESGYI